MIIGLGHKKGQGRNTIANHLVEKYGFTKIGFADAIVEECRKCRIETFYLNSVVYYINKRITQFYFYELPQYFQDWILKDGKINKDATLIYAGMTEKDPILMQWWGTDFRRKYFGEDYWVKKLREKIFYDSKFWKNNNKVVIPDVRFKNEAQMVIDLGGEVWRVERYDKDPDAGKNYIVPYISPDRDPDHISETDLDGWEFDETLEAESGDLEKLKKQVDKLKELNKGVK